MPVFELHINRNIWYTLTAVVKFPHVVSVDFLSFSFLSLCNVPQCGYSTIYLFILQLLDSRVVSSFRRLEIKRMSFGESYSGS